MRKSLLCFFLLFSTLIGANAQERTITGKVTSSDDGTAMPGVSVSTKGTSKGTTTDGNGTYKISVPANAKLSFSFIGFESQEISVGNNSTIDVVLVSSAAQLEEVVVTGYGAAVKKKEATGATANVKGEVIENMPLQSFDRALQGRMAGVQISSNNGTPGGAVSVRIRGVGSISAGNEPLYIVDGVQLNNRNDGGSTVNTNPLSFLNPNDIESIDVLKDAATAAIYGAQAANGVVIITTKKGKAGKTQIGFNYYKGVVEPIAKMDIMNTQEFIAARITALQTNSPATPLNTIRGNVLASLGLNRDLTDADVAALPTYDWQDAVYKNGTIDNYEVTAQGGAGKTTFYSSLSFNRQDAALINIDFQRIAGKISITNELTARLKMDLGVNLSSVTQRGPYGDADGTTAFGAPQYSAPLILPLNPIYNPDGSYYGMPSSGIVMPGDLSQNVVANSEYLRSTGTTNQAVGNLSLVYKISNAISLRGAVGLDYRNLKGSFFGDPRLSDYFAVRGSASEFLNVNSNINTNFTVNFNKGFGKHTVSGLGGFEYRTEVNDGVSFSGQGFPSPEFSTANAIAEPSSVAGFWSGVKRAGLFTNLKYDYAGKYLISGIVRYDGSSRFGANNRWGVFPSVSAKWLISEEAFLKDVSWVSDLGLRFSVGSTGNDQIGNFASRRLYGLNGVYQGNSGTGPSSLGNPNLKWERNVTYNAGLDYGFWGGKVKGAIDVFQRISKDLLLTRSIPTTNGFGDVLENIGEVQNKGIEFEINTVNFNKNKFKWETNFNFTALDNEVTKLFDGVDVLPGDLSIRVGYPLFTNVGVPYAGVNPANGRPMWYDPKGELTYLVRTADQRPLGHANLARYYGGFTNTFSYGNFEVSAFIQYEYGRTALNTQEFRFADNAAVLRNGLVYYWNNRWTTPGQITEVPRPAENRTEISGRVSSYQSGTRHYQDGSYIRFKQLNMSYSLPKSWLKPIRMSSARIYAQGINLFTWTKWTGFDPEFVNSSRTGAANQGIVPISRNYTLGIQFGL
jgi:TonB-dependent starch-binding outer membrane protein SusC